MARIASIGALALAALALAGCGFTPLYGRPGVGTTLSSVQVSAPTGRAGQLMREHLDDALSRDAGLKPQYRMDLQISEQRYPRGIRVDNVATRYEYVLTAAYTLVSTATGGTAKVGRVRVEVTYDSAGKS